MQLILRRGVPRQLTLATHESRFVGREAEVESPSLLNRLSGVRRSEIGAIPDRFPQPVRIAIFAASALVPWMALLSLVFR